MKRRNWAFSKLWCGIQPLHPPSAMFTARPSGSRRQHKPTGEYNTPARLGTKAGTIYNEIRCNNGGTQLDRQHICSHSLSAINHAFPHPEMDCIRRRNSIQEKLKMEDTDSQSAFPPPHHLALPFWLVIWICVDNLAQTHGYCLVYGPPYGYS